MDASGEGAAPPFSEMMHMVHFTDVMLNLGTKLIKLGRGEPRIIK